MVKRKIKLGVNIDHIATLRNARGENIISLQRAVEILKKCNVDSTTVHLREDRRHIKDLDVFELKKYDILPLNLEMAATEEMQKICLKVSPFACCIVPEKRAELTTEGGLDVLKQKEFLKDIIFPIIKKNIRVSLFVDPDKEQINAAKKIGANVIELNTGKFANNFQKKSHKFELEKINKAVNFAHKLKLECHAGHGINFSNVKELRRIKYIKEFNVGYSLICESIFLGLEQTIKLFKKELN